MAAVIAFGVSAVVSGDAEALWRFVVRQGWREPASYTEWYVLFLVLLGGMQGWALWQILRGWVAGEGVEPGRSVRWLRRAIYVILALYLVFLFSSPWWVDVAWEIGQLALVVLFYRVLDGTPRLLRVITLAVGTLGAVGSIGKEVFDELDVHTAEKIFDVVGMEGLLWALWMALILVAQVRDGRWGRTTVWSGAVGTVLSFLVLPLALGVSDGSVFTVIADISGVVAVLTLVWLARSAHDLAVPYAGAGPRRERPVPDGAPL